MADSPGKASSLVDIDKIPRLPMAFERTQEIEFDVPVIWMVAWRHLLLVQVSQKAPKRHQTKSAHDACHVVDIYGAVETAFMKLR